MHAGVSEKIAIGDKVLVLSQPHSAQQEIMIQNLSDNTSIHQGDLLSGDMMFKALLRCSTTSARRGSLLRLTSPILQQSRCFASGDQKVQLHFIFISVFQRSNF